MLHVSDLAKRYGDTLLFEQVSFTINHGERIGLIGVNGCGKTTLLRILIGQEQADRGSVRLAIDRDRVGYLPQGLEFANDTFVSDILYDRSLDSTFWAQKVESLGKALASADRDTGAQIEADYARALDRLTLASTLMPQHQIDTILAGLGLSDVDADTPVAILSGGQKTRLGLARILLRAPELLLLDEPTNHLDIAALEWLESYLEQFKGAILVVSHDRTFLDRTITAVMELSPETRRLTQYPGNYDTYVAAKRREQEKLWQQYSDQQERISQLSNAIDRWKGQATRIEHETIDFHYRKQAKKIARQGVVRQRRLERLLESEELLEKPKQRWGIKLDFVDTPVSGSDVLVLSGISKSFGDRLLFRDVDLTLLRGERIILVGPNGSGKTTLLRIITGEEQPSSGQVRVGSRVKIGYLAQEQETLDPALSILDTVQRTASISETEARNFLHYYLFGGDDVFATVGNLSFGERTRLALGLLVLKGCNLLLLDEPINHLDIPAREQFEEALSSFEGTVVAVVHDRYFVELFASSIWGLAGGTIKRYAQLRRALADMAM